MLNCSCGVFGKLLLSLRCRESLGVSYVRGDEDVVLGSRRLDPKFPTQLQWHIVSYYGTQRAERRAAHWTDGRAGGKPIGHQFLPKNYWHGLCTDGSTSTTDSVPAVGQKNRWVRNKNKKKKKKTRTETKSGTLASYRVQSKSGSERLSRHRFCIVRTAIACWATNCWIVTPLTVV